MITQAVFSECRRYRYTLTRIWDIQKPIVVFGLLNPSKADEKDNDPTVVKLISLAQRRWNKGGFLLINMYAWCASKPAELFRASRDHDVIGPENTIAKLIERIKACTLEPPAVVCGWGTNSTPKLAARIHSRGQEFVTACRKANIQCLCLNVNKDGSPQHPLYYFDEPILKHYSQSA